MSHYYWDSYAKCHLLNVIVLSVVLDLFMNVLKSVITPNGIMLNVFMLSVIMLDIIRLAFIMLNDIILEAIILCVACYMSLGQVSLC
jgi:hypothetical protein